jgi:penicillin-binding protein-related factor A (putative recombinase)
MPNPGKLFEQDFQQSVPGYAYVYRLKDCPGWVSACTCPGGASPRFVPNNAYDFILFWNGIFWAMELKSTKGVSFRFDVLRTNQWDGLEHANHTHGIEAGLLLNFRTDGETWWVPWNKWKEAERTSKKKSINIKEVREIGIRLPGKMKVVRWTWDVATWMREFRREDME